MRSRVSQAASASPGQNWTQDRLEVIPAADRWTTSCGRGQHRHPHSVGQALRLLRPQPGHRDAETTADDPVRERPRRLPEQARQVPLGQPSHELLERQAAVGQEQ